MQVLLTVAVEGVLMWVAIGTACLIMFGPQRFADIAARSNARKYGRLPSAQAEVIYFALAIICWPVAFWRAAR